MTKFGIVSIALLLVPALVGPSSWRRRPEPLASGVAANERLSALAGGLLYLLLLALAVTILEVQSDLPAHFIVGFILVPPLALKLASAGYRFMRYYTRNPAYRQAGPPPLALRLTAPVLVVSTVVAFASGFELWFYGLQLGEVWITVHNLSSVVMLLSGSVHLVGHLRRSGAVAADELRRAAHSRRSALPWLVVASLGVGLILGLASLLYASPFPASFGA